MILTQKTINQILFFDIETAPLYPNLDELEFNNKRLYDLWIKKEQKYKQLDEFKNIDNLDRNTIYYAKSSLEPEFSKVVCISFGFFILEDNILVKKIASYYGDDEKYILSNTSSLLIEFQNRGYRLSGYNIKGFDIPFIGRRMIYNSINLPAMLKVYDKKPWELPYIDIKEIVSFGTFNDIKNISLDLLACSMNIDSPKDDISGEDVHKIFWEDKDFERIKKYCEKDVMSVMEITSKISML